MITEKIDGTNAQVCISEDGQIRAGSRNRWITPEKDNFGFARWVEGNKTELLKLGPGRHFGEWWGLGIQRGYGLSARRFSLFNTERWDGNPSIPSCCGVVPVLYRGVFNEDAVNAALYQLATRGSLARAGYMNPEGIVIYHTASKQGFKVTLENDESPKSLVQGASE